MAQRQNVRTHTRRTKSGGQTTVHQHSRQGQGKQRKPIVSPRHAWKLARRAFAAGRRKKRVTAFVLGGLAVGELGAWLGLRGAGFLLATAGVLMLATAALAAAATGGDL
jgi:hypothetical protein